MTNSEELSEKIQICRELYLKHNGERHELIEQQMRYLGYHDFHRRCLYRRFERGTCTPGWIETYGWRGLLREQLSRKGTKIIAQGKAPGRDPACVVQHDPDPEGVERTDADVAPLQGADVAGTHPGVALAPLAHPGLLPLSPSATAEPLPDFPEFKTWLQRTWPNKNWEWKHLVYIYKHLKRVWDGDCKRLMIFMPPRHGKSELVTARFPAWTLKHDPTTKIIIGCYNQPLANRFSRMVRSCLAEDASRNADAPVRNEGRFDPNAHLPNKQQSPEEPAIADGGVRVPIFTFRRKDSESEWETSQGGGVRAVGVGAGITGYGAHLIIVDDPVKSRAEAESETCRERVWNWFNDDLYTRLEPDGKIILIQTRWHEDDLAGRLLREAEQGGEQWEVISLPALSEPPALAGGQTVDPNWPPAHAGGSDPLGRADGEALCPERYDETKLARIRRKIGSYSFAALYQQRPAPAEGGQFKRAWFRKIIDAPPPGLAWKRGYDLAVSTKQTADYTASFRCARDAQGNLYIADGFRARIEYPDQRRYILGRMQAEPNTEHGIEAALHGQAFVQDLRRERGLGRFAFRAVRVAADKLTRALSWLNLAEEGKLYLVRGPWIDAFVDEVARFPTGTHDDQIDAVSLAVNMLETRRYRSFGF